MKIMAPKREGKTKTIARAILEDVSPKVTGDDGLKALRICEGALRSIKEKRPIPLSCCKK
jgi:predicted dehydrogenase